MSTQHTKGKVEKRDLGFKSENRRVVKSQYAAKKRGEKRDKACGIIGA